MRPNVRIESLKISMGKMQKSKGARGERELASVISDVLDCDARRGRQYSGSSDSPDVMTSIDGLHIECKRTEQLRVWDALEQSERDAGSKVPVVCHRKNNKEWILIVKLKNIKKLMNVLNNHFKEGDTNGK